MTDSSVAIVGSGPVGLALAIDLAQRGVDVALFEKYETIHRIPKGQNLTQRSAESFRAWGVEERIRDAVSIPLSFGTKGLTAYGSLNSGYHYNWLTRSSVQEFYAAQNLRIPQYDAEQILRDRVAELDNVTAHYGSEVIAVSGSIAPVLTIRNRDNGAETTHAARFVVGCDGARSMVRDALGMTRTFRSNKRRMILSVFRSEELDDLMGSFDKISYVNVLNPEKEGYWQFFGRVEFGSWFFHTTVPDDSTLDSIDLDEILATAIGQRVESEVEYLGFWDLRIAVADDYRMDDVFIAGDAAHSHPPYGGYGVNNGFEDVRNLSWKLEAALHGWADEGLLDSYTAERKAVFDSTADEFIARMIREDADFVESFDPTVDKTAFDAEWARRSIGTKRDVEGYCPNYAGSPVVIGGTGSSSAVGQHSHKARPGFLLSPKDDLMDKLGKGFSVILIGDAEKRAGEFEAAAAALTVPLTTVKMAKTVETAQWEASMILARPDRFVGWVWDGTTEVDAAAILRQAIGGGQPDRPGDIADELT